MPSSVHRQHAVAPGAVAHSTVHVPSLAAPLRLMQITDSHCDLGPDAESGSEELCHYLHGRYVDGFKANEQRGPETVHGHMPVAPNEAFEAQLAEAKRCGVDLVVHTGDLLNFPSPKAADDGAVMAQRPERLLIAHSGCCCVRPHRARIARGLVEQGGHVCASRCGASWLHRTTLSWREPGVSVTN